LRSAHPSFARTDRLRRSGARISMDGKSRLPDDILIERRALARSPVRRCRFKPAGDGPRMMGERRSPECECVHPHARETGSEDRAGLRTRFELHDHRRPHGALDGQTPRRGPPHRHDETGTPIERPGEQLENRQIPSKDQ
jgi:putative transposase